MFSGILQIIAFRKKIISRAHNEEKSLENLTLSGPIESKIDIEKPYITYLATLSQ